MFLVLKSPFGINFRALIKISDFFQRQDRERERDWVRRRRGAARNSMEQFSLCVKMLEIVASCRCYTVSESWDTLFALQWQWASSIRVWATYSKRLYLRWTFWLWPKPYQPNRWESNYFLFFLFVHVKFPISNRSNMNRCTFFWVTPNERKKRRRNKAIFINTIGNFLINSIMVNLYCDATVNEFH